MRRDAQKKATLLSRLRNIGSVIAYLAAGTAAPLRAGSATPFGWAAARFTDAPVVLALRINEERVVPGQSLRYLRARVTAVLKGPADVPRDIAFLAQPRAGGQRWRGQDVLAAAVAIDRASATATLGNDGALDLATPERIVATRTLLAAVSAPGAPARIDRITGAFHSPGTVAGESETQLFFATPRGPGTLSVIRRSGAEPRWSVSFAEVLSEADGAPPRESLAGVRLACGLPPTLPADATAQMSQAEAEAATRDYALARDAIGPCPQR